MKLEKKQSVNVAVQHQAYSGPIPDPESLAKYETIQSGFAERIMRMAEDEAAHRRKNEIMLTKNIVRMATLGVNICFSFCNIVLWIDIVCINARI
ncbi:DUF2335 domain-containing protein [Viscerimonas tarda]